MKKWGGGKRQFPWSSRSEVNLKVTGNYGSERTNLCKRSLESRDSNPPHHNTLESFMSRRVLRDRSKTYFYYFVYIKNNKNLYIYIMHTHTPRQTEDYLDECTPNRSRTRELNQQTLDSPRLAGLNVYRVVFSYGAPAAAEV
uniref:Uncharacterized protein n=1 Tax=Cacopsylla melanoneura TaxID=428564 RepID=A0A8D9E7J9_9HEMI